MLRSRRHINRKHALFRLSQQIIFSPKQLTSIKVDRDARKATIIAVHFLTCREEVIILVLNVVAAECADDHARHALHEGKQAERPEEHIDTRHQTFDEQLER